MVHLIYQPSWDKVPEFWGRSFLDVWMKLDLDEFTFHRTLNEEDDLYRAAIYYLLSKKY